MWFGSRLDVRNNSLNLIRLVLAFAVLIHHSWPLAGAHGEPRFAGDTLGGWAVAGFFGISGYLITSLLLAERRNGAPLELADDERHAVHDGELSMVELCKRHDLVLDSHNATEASA